MSEDRPYEGQELQLFAAAQNWKNYWSGKVRPHLGRSVLEVGAGMGTNTPYLLGEAQESWLCLEPDVALAAQIPATLAGHPLRDRVTTDATTLAFVPLGRSFDTIIYIDVLEHIEDDHAELRAACARLNPGGKIVVLSPAHPWLYTPFDRAIGHFRRYTRKALVACSPPGARLVELFALDSLGLFASIANKLLLQQSMPTARQIAFWDRTLVTGSRAVDPIIGYSLGKSLVAVWQRNG